MSCCHKSPSQNNKTRIFFHHGNSIAQNIFFHLFPCHLEPAMGKCIFQWERCKFFFSPWTCYKSHRASHNHKTSQNITYIYTYIHIYIYIIYIYIHMCIHIHVRMHIHIHSHNNMPWTVMRPWTTHRLCQALRVGRLRVKLAQDFPFPFHFHSIS